MATPDGLPEKDIPNIQVAESAKQFREAAILLYRDLPLRPLVLPVLMNATFAVELYLKSLNSRNVYHSLPGELGYLVTARPQKRHPLTELFQGLDDEVRRALQTAYLDWNEKAEFRTLNDALDAYDTVFVDSRYVFEDPAKVCRGSINGLVGLMNFLGEFVSSLRGERNIEG